MKTHQLNTRIKSDAYSLLETLSKKLHTTKAYLVEKAIYHLNEQFVQLEKKSPHESPEDTFLSYLSKSMDHYDPLYRKLAK